MTLSQIFQYGFSLPCSKENLKVKKKKKTLREGKKH